MRKLAFLTFFLLTVASLPVYAAPYSTELNVDVTAENAAVAREKAMNQATRQAVYNVAASFTGADGLQLLGKMSNEQLLYFIVETTVLEEKSSNVRYMARLNVAVDGPLLKQYLQEKNIPMSAADMPDVVVIPVFRNSKASPALLWEDGNLWRAAWINYGKQNGLGKIRLLPPDLASEVNAAQALSLDGTSLQAVNTRFGNAPVYVAEASYDSNSLNIRLINAGNGRSESFVFAGEEPEALFNRGITETMESILRGQSQNQIMITSDALESIGVLVNYTSLRQWLETENKIRNLTPVENVQIKAIGNGRVQFQIDYVGGIAGLMRAFREKSYTLEPSGNLYILSSVKENNNG